MTGMETVIELRLARQKPAAVFVNLVDVPTPRDRTPLSATGIVSVDIGTAESVSDLDFRPLVGLQVHVSDFASNRQRHRKVAALIAQIEPAILVMPVIDGDNCVVHRRFAGDPPRTESITL